EGCGDLRIREPGGDPFELFGDALEAVLLGRDARERARVTLCDGAGHEPTSTRPPLRDAACVSAMKSLTKRIWSSGVCCFETSSAAMRVMSSAASACSIRRARAIS